MSVAIICLCLPVQGQTLLVLGDSIAAGYGLSDVQQGWVHLLGEKMSPHGWKVINAGISGDTTSDGLQRIDGLLERHRPLITLVELGGNDGLRGVPLSAIRQNLRRIIERIRRSGSAALLVGVTLPSNYGRRHIARFEKMYADLAEEMEVAFVSFAHTRVGTNPKYLQLDRIHPNAAAQPILAEAIWQELLQMLAPR